MLNNKLRIIIMISFSLYVINYITNNAQRRNLVWWWTFILWPLTFSCNLINSPCPLHVPGLLFYDLLLKIMLMFTFLYVENCVVHLQYFLQHSMPIFLNHYALLYVNTLVHLNMWTCVGANFTPFMCSSNILFQAKSERQVGSLQLCAITNIISGHKNQTRLHF